MIELDGSNHKKRKQHDKTRSYRLLKSGKVEEILRIKNRDLIQRPRFVYEKVIEIRNRIWDGE